MGEAMSSTRFRKGLNLCPTNMGATIKIRDLLTEDAEYLLSHPTINTAILKK
jgi:hypothetical protein